jgi:RNA polymerase sigma factor (sigma-70 family)
MHNPHGYVRASLVNLARDRHRRRHLLNPPVEVDERRLTVTADHAETLVAQPELDRLLRVLPARHRAAVVLRVIEGMSEAETASVMGCSAGTVKSSLSRGLTALVRHQPEGGP